MKVAFVLFNIVVFTAVSAVAEETPQQVVYEVKRGDRFETLARRFGTTPEEIRAANPRAYGTICGNPYTREQRNGERVAYCGRPRYYLIAGKTIVIPKARVLVELENEKLNSEIANLRAKLAEMRENLASQAQEIEALKQERNRLVEANAKLAQVNTAMGKTNNDLASQYGQARATADANLIARRINEIESREITVIIVVAVCIGIVILVLVFAWWSRRPLRNLERDRAHLELSRRGLISETEDLVRRRQAFEAEEQAARCAIEQERASQKSLRDQLTRWEEDLKRRNDRVDAAWREQDKREAALNERETSLLGREAACTAREKALEQEAKRLDTLRAVLESRQTDLEEKEHGVESLRQALAAEKARYDRLAIEQAEREERLQSGFDELDRTRNRLHAELDARRQVLDAREAAIDGKIRMFEEDIEPQIKDFARREVALREREVAIRLREEDIQRKDNLADLRLKELEEQKEELKEQQELLGIEQRELERRQQELAEERDAFERKVAEASRLIELAGGLEAAQSILKRAKKKAEITRALDQREQELEERKRALDEREQRLDRWEVRESLLEGVPRSNAPRKPTLSPPFPPPPIPGESHDLIGDDDDTELRLPTLEGPMAREDSMCYCSLCGCGIPLEEYEEHQRTCPKRKDKSDEDKT